MENLTVAQAWDVLNENFGVSEQTLQIVTDINGYNMCALEGILYSVAGLNSFDQIG